MAAARALSHGGRRRDPVEASGTVCLAVLGAVMLFGITTQRANALDDWNITLALLGLAGLFCAVFLPAASLRFSDRKVLIAALAFPAYIAAQLVPLPVAVLRVIDPARAEIADALRIVGAGESWAPLSIVPAETWAGLARVAGYALIFLLARGLARQFRNRIWAAAIPLMVFGMVETAAGLAQRSAGAQAVSGTYASKDHYAGLLEMTLPFVLMYGLAAAGQVRERGVAAWAAIRAGVFVAAAVAMFAAIGLSLSKMGFVSAVGSLAAMGAAGIAAKVRGWKRYAALAAMALVAVVLFVYAQPAEMVAGFGSAAADPTAEGRWPMARDTLHVIAAYPVFGSGFGTYLPAVLRYQTWGLNFAIVNAHNDYLQLLAELGAAGVLIAAMLAGMALMRPARIALGGDSREERCLGMACGGATAAMVIHSVADFNLYVPANAAVLAWIAGIAVSLGARRRSRRSASAGEAAGGSSRWARAAMAGLGIVAAGQASGQLALAHWYNGDAAAERAFCRWGVCDTNAAWNALLRGREGTSGVAAGEWIELLRRDPAGPYRWEDLAESLAQAGDRDRARAGFARALTLGPRIPMMLFRAGRFQLDSGERKDGLRMMAQALAGNAGLAPAIFGEFERRKIAVEDVTVDGLPAVAGIWREYLARQIAAGRVADADVVWRALTARCYEDEAVANAYVEFLVQKKELGAAARAWALYGHKRDESYPDGNLIFNGGFVLPAGGSRFNWQVEPEDGARIEIGSRGAEIRFDGTKNVTDVGLRETVLLKPGRYRFEASVRAKGITTDEGVAFQVVEVEGNRVLMRSEAVVGSSEGMVVRREFVVPSGVGLVEVGLARRASLRFDNLISGRLWVYQAKIGAE